jgi:hypothetical protein
VVVVVVDLESDWDFHTLSLKDIQETSIEKLLSILPDSAGFKTVNLAIDAADVLEEEKLGQRYLGTEGNMSI